MPLTLRQIRQNCLRAREAFAKARIEHFALGAFNLDNQETLIAVARAASNKKAPRAAGLLGSLALTSFSSWPFSLLELSS